MDILLKFSGLLAYSFEFYKQNFTLKEKQAVGPSSLPDNVEL
jgi:hypothetical protein